MRSLLDYAPDRILIVAPNWVGDVVMATPVMRVVRDAFPRARIGVVARAWLGEVLEGSPRFDELLLYGLGRRRPGCPGFWGLAFGLRARRFNAALILPHSFSTALFAWVAGAKRRLGYTRGDRGLLLTDSMPVRREDGRRVPVPKTDYYLALCRAAGLPVASEKPELFCRDEDRERAGRRLSRAAVADGERLALINPGANFGSSKCWMPERFAEVADRLAADHGVRVGVVCGPGEEPIVERILECARSRPVNFAQERLPLGELKALVERCDLLVTNDTGPRHFAVAFDKPVVVIMGSTDPRHTACNLDKTIVLRKDVPCGPCHRRTCPYEHECMKAVTADDVMGAAAELMAAHWDTDRSAR
jgi:heptosyltransferase-2